MSYVPTTQDRLLAGKCEKPACGRALWRLLTLLYTRTDIADPQRLCGALAEQGRHERATRLEVDRETMPALFTASRYSLLADSIRPSRN
jgi:hypothetical protein